MIKIVLYVINFFIFSECYNLEIYNKKIINNNLKYKLRINNLVLLNNENTSKYNLENNETKFPSFNKFIEERKKKENQLIMKYFNDAHKKSRAIEKKENYNKDRSTDLKLLSNVETLTWIKIWINDITGYNYSVPDFIYKDMFAMRDYCLNNNTKNYFYIAYIPSNKNVKDGPYYIGSFELNKKKKEFSTHMLIQNPNYNSDMGNNILNFKKELIKMTTEAYVFFKFNNLKEIDNLRYYYSWIYDGNYNNGF